MELSLKLIIYQTINFLVLMTLLGYLVNRFIRPFLRGRSEEIARGYAELDNGKKEVEYLKNAAHEQLLDIKQRSRQEIEKAVMDGNRMRESLIAKAEKEAAAVIERAKEEIGHEREKAIVGIRRNVSDVALRVASKLVGKQMNADINEKLVEEFLSEWKPETQAGSHGI